MTHDRDLHDVVIAFDIDNTLLDPDGSSYRRKVVTLLARRDLGLTSQEALDAFEWIRLQGAALDRIGLANQRHEPGCADGLAVLSLLHCEKPDLLSELRINPDERGAYFATFARLCELHTAAHQGNFDDRLNAECRVRFFCETDVGLARLREEAVRLARHPTIQEWSKTYEAMENLESLKDVFPLMTALRARGATLVVISEGRVDIQSRKLERLGVADIFTGRVLITECAARPPGTGELNKAITGMIDERIHDVTTPNPELPLFWYFRCLIDEWSTKSASFYARCLHAIQCDADNPQSALAKLAVTSAEQWAKNPLRFVMVGDRYDQDALPLIQLLGSDVGMTLRLRMGKYATLHPDEELPSQLRPARTFTSWDALSNFLFDELGAEGVRPIIAAPPIVRPTNLRWDYVDSGIESPHESVRAVAAAIRKSMPSDR